MYVSLIMDCTDCFPKTIYWLINELESVTLPCTHSQALEAYPQAFLWVTAYAHWVMNPKSQRRKSNTPGASSHSLATAAVSEQTDNNTGAKSDCTPPPSVTCVRIHSWKTWHMLQMKPLNILSQLVTYDRKVLSKIGPHSSTKTLILEKDLNNVIKKPLFYTECINRISFDLFASK